MAKKRDIKQTLATVREHSRNARCGKGVPGRFNPDRSVKFKSRTDKYDARGRSHSED